MCCHRLRSRVHNAGFLAFESKVTYPFHPLVDQTVLVTGSHEHEGVHYLLIRQVHGGSFQIPAWMFDRKRDFRCVLTPVPHRTADSIGRGIRLYS
ncbi:Y4bD/Y4pK family protein (plasmid) [Rhizobium sp. T136]|uniref:DUF5372 family protein n=1 Tax=Rhizobium sp. T136 TaxID=555319 RepID=UPI001E495476|nr:DUF5372 family protein [Rhizobium sp. T136]UFS84693.1 Y4bD/Y4pK family protein [Rhizobium sp. T136]